MVTIPRLFCSSTDVSTPLLFLAIFGFFLFLSCQIDVQLLVCIGLSRCSLFVFRLFDWLWLVSYHTNYVASCIVPFSSDHSQPPPADNTTKILISVLGSFFGVVICTLLVVYRIFFRQGKNVLLFCALCML